MNTPDDSEPMWEMDELLEETEKSVEEEKKTNETTEQNTPIKTLQTEIPSEFSSWVTRQGIVYSLSGLFALGLFLYAAGFFDRDTNNVRTQKSIQTRTEKDIHRWLEQMEQLTTSLSKRDVAIQSSTLSGFHSNMQQRPELRKTITKALKNDKFDVFQRTTRDIGSALQNASTKTKSSLSDNPINQNKQLVKTFRKDIEEAWNDVKRKLSEPNTRVDASSSTSPSPHSTGSSSPEAGQLK